MMNDKAREELLPVTAETTNLEGDGQQNSAAKASTGDSLVLSNNKKKVIPRYLRASTGSCHDFCKYGGKHTFETKGKHPTLPRFSCSSVTPEKKPSKVNGPNLAERQKETAKKKSSTHCKNELPDGPKICVERDLSPEDIVECTETQIILECTETQINNQNSFFPEKIKSSESSETTECNFPLTSEKIVSLEGFETVKQDTPVESIVLHNDPETVTQKTTPVLEKTEVSKYSETANKKKPSVKKNHLSLGPASVEQRTQSSKMVFASVEVKQRDLSPVEISISPGLPRISKKGTSLTKRPDAIVRSAPSGKPRTTTLKSMSLKNPSAGTSSRKNESKGVKNVELSNPREKKTLRPPSTSFSQSSLGRFSNFTNSVTPVSHPRKAGKTQLDFDKIKEKTLYIIEPGQTRDRNFESAELKASSCQPSLSSSSSSLSSLLSYSPSVSDNKEEGNQDDESTCIKPCSISEHGGEKANEAGRQSQVRKATAHQQDKDPNPYKLKFRRGKVVDAESDDSGARRLRFKQGRMLGNEQSGKREVEKRSFRRKQLAGGDLNYPDPETKTVVLRHQDVQDKRDAPDLLNQIIEETASKLVKTRKSKVKALVGAFETVISLQDIKPAASV